MTIAFSSINAIIVVNIANRKSGKKLIILRVWPDPLLCRGATPFSHHASNYLAGKCTRLVTIMSMQMTARRMQSIVGEAWVRQCFVHNHIQEIMNGKATQHRKNLRQLARTMVHIEGCSDVCPTSTGCGFTSKWSSTMNHRNLLPCWTPFSAPRNEWNATDLFDYC